MKEGSVAINSVNLLAVSQNMPESYDSTIALRSKVVQIIKCTCTVFVDNFRNISTNSSI